MQRIDFHQPWQLSDSIRLQLVSNYAPLKASLVDCFGRVYYTANLQQKQEDELNPGSYIYEIDIALNIFDEGLYWLKVECGSPIATTLISEPLKIAETHEKTVLLAYKHRQHKDGAIFETGFAPTLRVPGAIRFKQPASRDTLYEDQELNLALLDSRSYRLYELILGEWCGVPDYYIDIVDRILGCSEVKGDGRQFTKSDGAKWEESSVEDYEMRGWKIELRDSINRGSLEWENDELVTGTMAVVINVDSKGFGVNDNGGSIYQVTDIN